jgi:RecA/RadA recombinase
MPRGRPKKVNKQEELKIETTNEPIEEKKDTIKTVELTAREKKTNVVLRDLNKQLGGDFLKPASSVVARERLPFRQEALNKLTGGGIPYGTFTTIYGSKGCSKTTIAYQLIAEAQKRGNICLYADIERSYDALWASQCGVDINKLLYGAFYMAEQPLDAIIKICKEKAVDFVVVDSLHGLSPKSEQIEKKTKEKSVEDDTIALLARKLAQFFRMAVGYVAEAKCAILLIGQSRMDLGSFIKLETLSGGHALLHFSRLILKVRRGQGADAPTEKVTVETDDVDKDGEKIIKKEDKKVGFDLVIKTEKSQINGCVEGDEIHMSFYFKEGLK